MGDVQADTPSGRGNPAKASGGDTSVAVRHERFPRWSSIVITVLLSPPIVLCSSFVLIAGLMSLESLGLKLSQRVEMFLFRHGFEWAAIIATLALAPFVYHRLRWRVVEYEGHYCWKCRHDFGTAPSETCPDCGTDRIVVRTSVGNPWLNAVGWMLCFIITYALASFVMGGLVMQGVPLPRWLVGGIPIVLAAVNATLRLRLSRRKLLGKEEARRQVLRARGLCHTCAYDLTGNVSGRCPECGTAIERLA